MWNAWRENSPPVSHWIDRWCAWTWKPQACGWNATVSSRLRLQGSVRRHLDIVVVAGESAAADSASGNRIHGISDAMVASAPTFAQLAPTVAVCLSDCDLAGYNIERFDRRLLTAEFRRVGMENPTAGARVIDAYAIFVRQESRSLEAALRFYGVEEELIDRQAHDAGSDVTATVAVLVAQLGTYSDMPKTVNKLHAWLYPRDPQWIDADGSSCGGTA